MPPSLALLLPTDSISCAHVMNLLEQSHRIVIIHHAVGFYWLKSFVGFILFSLRLPQVDVIVLVNRLKAILQHSATMKGMALMQALDSNLFMDVSCHFSRCMLSRLQIRAVLVLLCCMDGSMGCVGDAIQWFAMHPLGIQMARCKEMRPVMFRALNVAKPAMRTIPLLENCCVMRFLVRVGRHVPVALDCIAEEDVCTWTVPCMQVILDDGRWVDFIAWRCMFQTGVSPSVLNILLDDMRYRHREWQIPLRLHTCVRDQRPPFRLGGPLARLVSAEIPRTADIAEALEIVVFSAIPPFQGLGSRWWHAATRSEAWQSQAVMMMGWLLRRLRLYLQTTQWKACGETIPVTQAVVG